MGHQHHTLEEEEERFEHFEHVGHLDAADGSPYDSRSPGARSDDSLVLSSPEGSPVYHYSRGARRQEEELEMDPDEWMDRVSSMKESR